MWLGSRQPNREALREVEVARAELRYPYLMLGNVINLPKVNVLLVKQYQEKLSNLKHWVIDH